MQYLPHQTFWDYLQASAFESIPLFTSRILPEGGGEIACKCASYYVNQYILNKTISPNKHYFIYTNSAITVTQTNIVPKIALIIVDASDILQLEECTALQSSHLQYTLHSQSTSLHLVCEKKHPVRCL